MAPDMFLPASARESRPVPIDVELLMASQDQGTAPGGVRELTTAVARGDEAAFRRLYDLYNQRLFRLVLVLDQGDAPLAHETVQAVMLTAAGKLRPLNTEEHLWNWLARVARQHLSKVWRRRKREASLIEWGDRLETVEASAVDSVLERSLDAAMSSLDPGDREVLELFYFEGLSHKAIATRLGTTAKAVSSRLERLRTGLRSLLKRRLSDGT